MSGRLKMSGYAGLILMWCLCVLLPGRTHAQTQDANGVMASDQARGPTITVTEPDMSDKTLRMSFTIRNDSGQDIWICEDISLTARKYDFEAYMAKDRESLLIRRRLDIDPHTSVIAPPEGRYVRLREGQARSEVLYLSLPVESRFFWGFPSSEGKAYAKKLVLEIGYYLGDMPDRIRGVLKEAGREPSRTTAVAYPIYPTTTAEWFGSLLRFNWVNWPDGKLVKHRDQEVVIPWTGSIRMGEQVLRIVLDDVNIPYEEKYEQADISSPDLSRCTRLEIRYQPSVLDYFFPYPNERALMSPEELKYLQSLQTVVADDQEQIRALAREVSEEGLIGGLVSKRSTAHVVCYRDGERLTSFTIYDDRAIITEDEQCIRYGIGLPSLKRLTSPIRAFQLRLACADNLRNLWSVLRLLYGSRAAYPRFRWCSAIINDRRADDVPTEYMMRYLKCPAAGQGKCHYAINPDCRPNSPADTVLLFETRVGWNRRGGRKLFTFDNHDPRGGLVLLNDGTVKFVRTEDESKQLRWK